MASLETCRTVGRCVIQVRNVDAGVEVKIDNPCPTSDACNWSGGNGHALESVSLRLQHYIWTAGLDGRSAHGRILFRDLVDARFARRGKLMKILIVDDEPLARQRLRDLLSDLPDVRIIGEAADGRAACEFV
jgi:hypothetical protein